MTFGFSFEAEQNKTTKRWQKEGSSTKDEFLQKVTVLMENWHCWNFPRRGSELQKSELSLSLSNVAFNISLEVQLSLGSVVDFFATTRRSY